jgi:predicted TIM-barrel fold metal-dependent hydrolase
MLNHDVEHHQGERKLVIDFHTYLGQDAYGDYSQTAEELVATMDACRINQAVVTPLLDFPGPDPQVHRALYDSCHRFPGRLIPFARLDPRYGRQALEELTFTVDKLGFKGLLFDPASTRSLPYHPKVLPLMQAAADREIPVLIPTGNVYVGLPEQVAMLAARMPSLKIVLGHMGTAAHALRAIHLASRYGNLYLEISLQQSPFRLPLCFQVMDGTRVLFGSAAPYSHPSAELVKIQVAAISPRQKAMILGCNARALLRL